VLHAQAHGFFVPETQLGIKEIAEKVRVKATRSRSLLRGFPDHFR
jgi:hypothetical protein